MCESCRKLDLRFLYYKMETFHVPVPHLLLRLAFVQNKFQQANKTKINHINDNYIKFEVSLHFEGIWPTVHHTLQNCLGTIPMLLQHIFLAILVPTTHLFRINTVLYVSKKDHSLDPPTQSFFADVI